MRRLRFYSKNDDLTVENSAPSDLQLEPRIKNYRYIFQHPMKLLLPQITSTIALSLAIHAVLTCSFIRFKLSYIGFVPSTPYADNTSIGLFSRSSVIENSIESYCMWFDESDFHTIYDTYFMIGVACQVISCFIGAVCLISSISLWCCYTKKWAISFFVCLDIVAAVCGAFSSMVYLSESCWEDQCNTLPDKSKGFYCFRSRCQMDKGSLVAIIAAIGWSISAILMYQLHQIPEHSVLVNDYDYEVETSRPMDVECQGTTSVEKRQNNKPSHITVDLQSESSVSNTEAETDVESMQISNCDESSKICNDEFNFKKWRQCSGFASSAAFANRLSICEEIQEIESTSEKSIILGEITTNQSQNVSPLRHSYYDHYSDSERNEESDPEQILHSEKINAEDNSNSSIHGSAFKIEEEERGIYSFHDDEFSGNDYSEFGSNRSLDEENENNSDSILEGSDFSHGSDYGDDEEFSFEGIDDDNNFLPSPIIHQSVDQENLMVGVDILDPKTLEFDDLG